MFVDRRVPGYIKGKLVGACTPLQTLGVGSMEKACLGSDLVLTRPISGSFAPVMYLVGYLFDGYSRRWSFFLTPFLPWQAS